MIRDVLKDLGLSHEESTIYLALLRMGPSSVKKIQIETRLHRTSIYDYLEKLQTLGLVHKHKKEHTTHFVAAAPERLRHIIEDQKNRVESIIPELEKITRVNTDAPAAEVYAGREGFKLLMKEIINTKKDYVAFGVDEEYYSEEYKHIIENHFQKEIEIGISSRIITREGTSFVYPTENTEYKYVPEEYFEPASTIIYGSTVFIHTPNPETAIFIRNKTLADSYRKHFELLWKLAKKTNQRK